MTKPVKHMVVFTLKYELDTAETRAFLDKSAEILSAIPQVQQFEVFRQVSVKTDYHFGFSMVFADRGAYLAYNEHPAHMDYVKQVWEKEVLHFQEIDFEALD
ncbi:Dabb family protein [Paenibacillus allorhizosphaerae]|uniref:Stress-response A/B barrel domain-containing protein n=1 Tax=Paenibacillus allorhizosphaerae TaxID=2849866 RepID=A0ABM8VGX7_9BACL|nr:Dabb family protein [Paenibacillus allorhizosphaerae]CAG7639938.1 hypothetical protein PAECIP111802_02595 [Paenibacillus allorhizosphaerae]